jgi:hypothetical protein
VVIDGRIVLAGHAGFYDAVASEPLIGGPMPGRPDWRFTGRIISSVRLPVR